MASAEKNLSVFRTTNLPDVSNKVIGIIATEWNEQVVNPLMEGARNTLSKCGVTEDNIPVFLVPGSYELPTAAQFLAQQEKVDAIICLGCIVQGETPHFDYICQAVAQGIKDVSLKCNKPVIFGVLTTLNQQQALDRAGGKHGNKGDEAAISAIKMLQDFSV